MTGHTQGMAMEHRSLGGAKLVKRKMKGGLLVAATPQELGPRESTFTAAAVNTQLEPIQNAVQSKPDDSKRCKSVP